MWLEEPRRPSSFRDKCRPFDQQLHGASSRKAEIGRSSCPEQALGDGPAASEWLLLTSVIAGSFRLAGSVASRLRPLRNHTVQRVQENQLSLTGQRLVQPVADTISPVAPDRPAIGSTCPRPSLPRMTVLSRSGAPCTKEYDPNASIRARALAANDGTPTASPRSTPVASIQPASFRCVAHRLISHRMRDRSTLTSRHVTIGK